MAFKKKAIILPLLLGVPSIWSSDDQEILQATGTSHLLAISGLHLGLVSSGICLFSSMLWKKLASKSLVECITATEFAAVVGAITAIIYAAISGFNLPTMRALIMTIGSIGAMLVRRLGAVKKIYCLSIWVLLIWEPFNILTISFWLSYGAVGVLLYGTRVDSYIDHNQNHNNLKIIATIFKLLKINWLMLIGLIPLNLWFFGKVYLISYVANFIAIPWINCLILPWILLALIWKMINLNICQCLMMFADLNLTWLLMVLKWLSQFNQYILLESIEIKLGTIALSLITSIWLLLPKGLINKYIALLCLMPLLWEPKEVIKPGDAIVTVLDVGQGLGVVIKLHQQILLYDVGSNNGAMANYLQALKIKHIAKVIISHPDHDHIGALPKITKQHEIHDFFTNVAGYQVVDLSSKLCEANMSWELDGVKFEFFSIFSSLDHQRSPQLSRTNNDSSCILKMTGNGYSMLYSGDISKKVEKQLLVNDRLNLTADVLLIPHHGSNSSSSTEFIAAVQPKYAIVSAGYLNQYHHPRTEVVARYLAKNIKIFNTIEHGSIVLKFYDNSLKESQQSNNIQISWYKSGKNKFWNY